jgi:hypothetical protein
MATQRQVRGATQATQEGRTLASRELDINTTDGRMCVHNGSTVGGIPHATYADTQNREWTYAAASGTDTITASMAKAPAAYAAGQGYTFKAANTNTGSATININSLGAKTIKKVSGGSIVTLVAGDIVAGGIYQVNYDGTDMLLSSGGGGGTFATQTDQETGTSTTTLVAPGTQHYHPSAAKFWAKLRNTMVASYNVTSLTEQGNGRITFTIATDFSSADWCCVATAIQNTTADSTSTSEIVAVAISRNTAQAAGTVNVICREILSGSSATEADYFGVHVVGFGDQ